VIITLIITFYRVTLGDFDGRFRKVIIWVIITLIITFYRVTLGEFDWVVFQK